jgi:hypothetical protein
LAALHFNSDKCLIWPFAKNSAGYAHLSLDRCDILAHRYVCEKVRGPAPLDKPMALHTCASGHLGCIAPWHLKWGDRHDNATDMVSDGRSRRGQQNSFAKLTPAGIRAIRAAAGTQEEIARRFGVTQSNVSCILRRKTWGHVS